MKRRHLGHSWACYTRPGAGEGCKQALLRHRHLCSTPGGWEVGKFLKREYSKLLLSWETFVSWGNQCSSNLQTASNMWSITAIVKASESFPRGELVENSTFRTWFWAASTRISEALGISMPCTVIKVLDNGCNKYQQVYLILWKKISGSQVLLPKQASNMSMKSHT